MQKTDEGWRITWSGVVKVQMPLAGNDMTKALIYSENKIINQLMPIVNKIEENQTEVTRFRENQRKLQSFEIMCATKKEDRYCKALKEQQKEIEPILHRLEASIIQNNILFL